MVLSSSYIGAGGFVGGWNLLRCFEVLDLSPREAVSILNITSKKAIPTSILVPSKQIRGCRPCQKTSDFPGCNNPYCEKQICKVLKKNKCCTDSWDYECAFLATSVCNPEAFPKAPAVPCPLGFICNDDGTFMSNCSDVRALPIERNLGDVFGGVYCMEGRKRMINCPQGYYCPTPFEKIICPKGFFCPHKSTEPWIECKGCEEGATELKRDPLDCVIIGIGLFILVVAMVSLFVRQYKKYLWGQQTESAPQHHNGLNPKKQFKRSKVHSKHLNPKPHLLFSKRLHSRPEEEQTRKHSQHQLGSDQCEDSSACTHDFEERSTNISNTNISICASSTLKADNVKSHTSANITTMDTSNEIFPSNKIIDSKSVIHSNGKKLLFDDHDNGFGCSSDDLEENIYLYSNPEVSGDICDDILLENYEDEMKGKLHDDAFVSLFMGGQHIFSLIKKFREITQLNGPQSTTTGSASTQRELQYDTTIIPRHVFTEHFPAIFSQVTRINYSPLATADVIQSATERPGVDICFKNLSLSVNGSGRVMNVVDHVTGRIRAKSMTALMGGSGVGKTSLLNALCGRAFYGEVNGDVYINGQAKSIEEIKDIVGFVPQDDIVHAELTVRENFVYAGRFRLPRGTSPQVILDLADETLASLGLARVADSLVGDVKRRGVSGGEKKRVNIGVELMSKPSCLFLDEPTSGLDASSALRVMECLRHLVDDHDVTVVSAIHQPRKFIFDLFDSLILLGVGGKMIYHGKACKAFDYFDRLNYVLPPGESVSDWLLDISSGRLEPQPTRATSNLGNTNQVVGLPCVDVTGKITSSDGIEVTKCTMFLTANGINGAFSDTEATAFEETKPHRAALLHEKWNEYFEQLDDKERSFYDIPEETELPKVYMKPSFLSQLYYQISREFLISWRNLTNKLIDTFILISAAIIITATEGLPEMTRSRDPNQIEFREIVRYDAEELSPETITELFIYSFVPQWRFPLKIGIIVAVLVGLQAFRIITSKRLEFFREASSGYNIDSYFVSVQFVSTIEHSLQIIVLSFFVAWLRDPIASRLSYFVHFLAMIWICVSWALFFPMIVPAENVSVTVGFFMSFCGLIIAGVFPPLTWEVIYKEGGIGEHIAGWLSPTRYFLEGLTVGEYRCLPPQSGWTVSDESINLDRMNSLMHQFGIAGHDPNVTQQSYGGWYWGILPSIFVGLTVRYASWLAMHSLNRGHQTKKSIWFEMMRDKKMVYIVFLLVAVLFGLIVLTTWLYTRDVEANYIQNHTGNIGAGGLKYSEGVAVDMSW